MASDNFSLGYELGIHLVNACVQLREHQFEEIFVEFDEVRDCLKDIMKAHPVDLNPIISELDRIEKAIKSDVNRKEDLYISEIMELLGKIVHGFK